MFHDDVTTSLRNDMDSRQPQDGCPDESVLLTLPYFISNILVPVSV